VCQEGINQQLRDAQFKAQLSWFPASAVVEPGLAEIKEW